MLFCDFFGYAEDSRYFCVYLSWVARTLISTVTVWSYLLLCLSNENYYDKVFVLHVLFGFLVFQFLAPSFL